MPDASRARVHLFFPYATELAGSELRTLEIARGLRAMGIDARIWATSARSRREFRRQHGIRLFTPFDLGLRGSFVFVGCFWKPKRLLRMTKPDKLTVIVNTMAYAQFQRHLPLYRNMAPDLRIAYTSALQRQLFGVDGEVHVSPIDLQRFHPRTQPFEEDRPLRVGRISRDIFEKHQFLYDPPLYEALADEGMTVDLIGATCLRPLLTDRPEIRLRPAGAVDSAEFLRSLDVFFYRTGAHYDPAARVVWEAMATGLPVVCHRFAGHADHIRHGENGFLFDDQHEAVEILRQLRDDPELRMRIGRAARQTMEALFAPARLRAMYAQYL